MEYSPGNNICIIKSGSASEKIAEVTTLKKKNDFRLGENLTKVIYGSVTQK